MSQTVDEGKGCAILAYLIVGIIWFFADKKMKKNTFAKFHTKQAIIFIIFLLIVNIAVALFSMISDGFGQVLGYVVYTAMTILWILAIIYAAAGKEKEIPVIGTLAKELDF